MRDEKANPGAGGQPGRQNFHIGFYGSLPHYDYEKNILGCILENGDLIDKVAGLLTPEDFYFPKHRVIFRCILRMRKNQIPIGVLEVFENLKTQGLLEEAGGWLYVSGLKEIAVSPKNIEYQASEVKKAAKLNHLLENGQKLNQAIERKAPIDEIRLLQEEIARIQVEGNSQKQLVRICDIIN